MIEFLNETPERKRELIAQASILSGMGVKAIEKDWWVTLILKALFQLPMASHFIFKGGTSLSKGWKLIERFSEDIDIALSPEAFGMAYQMNAGHSHVKSLKRKGCVYTSTVIRNSLWIKLIEMGVPEPMIIVESEEVNPLIPDKDPQTILVRYPSLYDPSAYIADSVKLEFGVRSPGEPFAAVSIRSILSEFLPAAAYAEDEFTVMAVEPRKTYIEKMFLLHEKFHAADKELIPGERQFRHLFDLGRMDNRDITTKVWNDPELYNSLLAHRKSYVRMRGVDYAGMHMTDIFFIPPPETIEFFRRDYETMLEEMIYATDAPPFDELMDHLRTLNGHFALMETGRNLEELIASALSQKPDLGLDENEVIVEYPGNPSEKYLLYFILRKGQTVFHKISRLS